MTNFKIQDFKNPPKEHSVIYTWVWNMPVTKEGIDQRLEAYAQAGIKGLYILPLPKNFRPGYMQTYLEPEYLSNEYFSLVEYAFKKAEILGFNLWLYDEGGWPSGGAAGRTLLENANAAETRIFKRDVFVKKGQYYNSGKDVLAVFCGKKRLVDQFTAKNDITITEYYAEKSTEKHPNRVDCTNKSVVDTFISNTYEQYYKRFSNRFGNKITAFFTDEPALLTNTLPENLTDIFYKKYGYDILDFLPFVLDGDIAESDAECKARIDYERLLGELFYENFCKNIADWCQRHNIKMAGHLDIDHTAHSIYNHGYFSHLHCLSAFQIPGVDVIWEQIRYPYNGRVPVSEGVPFFPRIASSAAHQNGSNLAVTESFAVFGDGITPDEMRYVINYQAIRGINVFNFMLLSNSCKGASALVERPVFSPEKPGFFNLEHINKYCERLSYLLKLGSCACETALYNPCADYWANTDYCNAAESVYTSLGVELEKNHIDFDIIDDYAVLAAEASEHGLKLGNAVYKNVVVPSCHFMPDEVKQKLAPFIKAPSALIDLDDNNLRVKINNLTNGRLVFIFNEGEKTVKTKLNLAAKYVYSLSLACGEIYPYFSDEIELVCGDMAVFYLTDKQVAALSKKRLYTKEIGNFSLKKVMRYRITSDGLVLENGQATQLSPSFSGEVSYTASFSLDNPISPTDRYLITLSDTSVSAQINLNGKRVATVGVTPMQAVIKGELLKKDNQIEIIVATTAANELVTNHNVFEEFDPADVGSYDKRSIVFERQFKPLKFGKVYISLLEN